MRFGLIFSNDWEIFGDGSGKFFEIQHRPLQALLEIMSYYGAKLTVMAEVGQQWAHKNIAGQEPWAAVIAEAWECILKECIKRGNDVQLHLHPQWLKSIYKDGKWDLNFDHWAISNLEPNFMETILYRGKRYLDDLLKPLNKKYECIAFRAGDYCIEPSNIVIQKLLRAGIVCDSSIVKGKHKWPFFDYRDAHSNAIPWFASPESVKYQNKKKEGLLEIPIYSQKVLRSAILQRFSQRLSDLFSYGVVIGEQSHNWQTERYNIMKKKYPSRKSFPSKESTGIARRLLRMIISKSIMQLDYDYMPCEVFLICLKHAFKRLNKKKLGQEDLIIPIMATGHVKEMHNCENIDRILCGITRELGEKVIFWKISDAIRYWIDRFRTAM